MASKEVLFEVGTSKTTNPTFQIVRTAAGDIETHYDCTYPSREPTYTGAKLATDANGNVTGFVGPGGRLYGGGLKGSRPRLLVVGNSLAGLNNISLVGNTTTLTAQALAGATSVTVASISGLSSGDKIAIGLYEGTIFLTTINGAPAGNTVTLATALPRMARSGASLQKYTTAAPSDIRRVGGPLYLAMAKLGMPVEMIQGYGYGSGTLPEIMMDLPRILEATRPQYVHFIDVENSLAANMTFTDMIAWARYKIRTCLSYGATPLINTAYPSNSYAGADITNYDEYNDWVTSQMEAEWPGSVAVNVGYQWQDPAQPTLRTPLAGWTDGIHPNINKYASIAEYYADALADIVPVAASVADFSLTANPLLDGSGGTNSGMQGGSVVPASWKCIADAGVTATSSSGAGGGLSVVMSVPGTSNITTTTYKLYQRYTLPAAGGSSDQALVAFIKVKINTMTGISMAYPYLAFSGGEQYSSGQDAGLTTNAEMLGNTYQFETPVVKVPLGATYVDFIFWVRPTTGLSNGVAVDIEILEAGIIPAAYVTY